MSMTLEDRLGTLQVEVAQAQELLARTQETVDRIQGALGTASEVVVQTKRWAPRIGVILAVTGVAAVAVLVVVRRRRSRPDQA